MFRVASLSSRFKRNLFQEINLNLKMNFCKVFLTTSVLAFLFATPISAGVTEEQMWATAKLMRDVCLPRFPKISIDLANQLRDGNIPENNKDVKCYINCVLEMMQTMKKGKFLYEASLKQVDLILPDSYKDDYRAGLLKCKDASAGIKKDNCEAAYTILKCLRGEIKKFIFP